MVYYISIQLLNYGRDIIKNFKVKIFYFLCIYSTLLRTVSNDCGVYILSIKNEKSNSIRLFQLTQLTLEYPLSSRYFLILMIFFFFFFGYMIYKLFLIIFSTYNQCFFIQLPEQKCSSIRELLVFTVITI